MFKSSSYLFIILGLALFALVPHASASTGGGGLPWESPLNTLTQSMTGPVPYAISLMGIVCAGTMIIFGGEMAYFVRGLLVLVLTIAMIIAAKNFLSGLGLVGAGSEVGAIKNERVYVASARSSSSLWD
jgi:type IV secretory pathway VirB2 component (pilin)